MPRLEHPRNVKQLTQGTFAEFVAQHPRAIVLYQPTEAFSAAIVAYFSSKYPDDHYGFGVLSERDIYFDPWWREIVSSVVARPDNEFIPYPPPGYYFFIDGTAAAFQQPGVGDVSKAVSEALVDLVTFAFFDRVPPVDKLKRDKERAAPVIKAFDCSLFRGSVKRRLRERDPATGSGDQAFAPAKKKAIAALSSDAYSQVLGLVAELGRQMERLPSTYEGKNEEALRDHLLTFLDSHFEGSATGETFNKAGKTDILLRHGGHNVFLAECKFWSGAKNHLSHIDQLLRYLTWRDTKVALIIFCDRQNATSVSQRAKDATREHPSFLGALEPASDGWDTVSLGLPGDPGAAVTASVGLFHFPKAKSQ